MTRHTCTTCIYRKPDERPDFADHGECRRFPPQVSQWTHPDHIGPQFDQHWPYVGPDHWCGEHKL